MWTAKKIEPQLQDAWVQSLETSPLEADLPAAELALLRYGLKLTERPGEMSAEDVIALREEGFDDRAIHDACAITSYFAFVNRMADGLGVQVE